MEITLNGQKKHFSERVSLKYIIDQFCRNSKTVIIELNGTIIKDYVRDQQILKDGDILELINFMGGG